MKKKRFSTYGAACITYEFTCPECQKTVQVTGGFNLVGGCTGNHGPGEYCYCPDRHLEEDVTCPECGAEGELNV